MTYYLSSDGVSYALPEYTKKRVNWAGRVLAQGVSASAPGEWDLALGIIDNWRASHARPLVGIRVTLGRRASDIDPNALIAQRQKRLASIASKLRRFPAMQLSQMQDLGGCRAVVQDISALRALRLRQLVGQRTKDRVRPEICKVDDYLAHPKADGYRGIHLIYKFRTTVPDLLPYDGLRVEVQLRSRLQHLWATSVETVGAFTHQALKSGLGEEDWRRFFTLVAARFAIRERAPQVPETPQETPTLVAEIRQLAVRLNVISALESMDAVVKHVNAAAASRRDPRKLYLLELHSRTNEVRLWGFEAKHQIAANEFYLQREKQFAGDPSVQAVLVSVDSLTALPAAYPNYYADTNKFVRTIRRMLWG